MPSPSLLFSPSADLSPPGLPPDAGTIHTGFSYTISSDMDLVGEPGIKLDVKKGVTTTLTVLAQATLDGAPDAATSIAVLSSTSTKGDAEIDFGGDGALIVSNHAANGLAEAIDVSVRDFTLGSQGAIGVTASQGTAYGLLSHSGLAQVQLGTDATITVTGGVQATGISLFGGSVVFDNAGHIHVAGGDAQGVAVQATGAATVSNEGQISVVGTSFTGTAAGVVLHGAILSNTGVIHVSGKGHVIGVEDFAVANLTNGHKIVAVSGDGLYESIGVVIQTAAAGAMHNNGSIHADVAIASADVAIGDVGLASDDLVDNTGHIHGDIRLGLGNDTLDAGGSITGDIDLGDGNDSLNAKGGHIMGSVYGGLGDDLLVGSGHADTLFGDAADGSPGAGGNDLLRGLGGADNLSGGDGNDTLLGGAGGDTLTGGAGDDVFQFNKLSDAPGFGATDTIMDLEPNDFIDLSRIDGDSVHGGFQPFHQVSSFTGNPGELTIFYDGSGMGSIAGDTDGNGSPDFVIVLVGDHTGFTNFVL